MPLAARSLFALFLIVPRGRLLNSDAPRQQTKTSDQAKTSNQAVTAADRLGSQPLEQPKEETIMAWTTPTLVEICLGLEINGYLPAEF